MGDACVVQALDEVRTQGVHGDAVIGNQDIHTVAGRGDSYDLLTDGSHTAAGQGGHNNADLGTGSGIGVTAGSAAKHAVRAGQHVDVKAGVDFQCGQNNEIQLVDKGALVSRVGVLGSGHLKVVGGLVDGVDGIQIEVLHVDDFPDLALLQQLHHGAADAADGPAHLDAPLVHVLFQEQVGSQRGAAHAGLEGEALLEIGSRGNNLGHILGHHQIPGVLADAGSGGGNLLGVADGIDNDNGIHVNGFHGSGHIGEVHQAVGNDHHMVGILGVGHGIAHGAAVALAADAPAVAHAVRGGSSHKGDVDVNLTGLDGTGTAAVGTDDGGGLQLSGGNDLAHPAADAGGLDADDLALFNIVSDGIMGAAQARCGNGQVLQAQLLDGGLHDHVDHIIAVTQMVMEGEGHTVLGTALLQGVHQSRDDLALLGLLIAAGGGGSLVQVLAVHIVLALVNFLAVYQQRVRNFSAYCVDHTKSPSYIPQAFARRSVRSAPGMKAISIILPLTVNTPTPAADCSL